MFIVTVTVINFRQKFVQTANFSTEIFFQALSAVAFILTQ